jgi:GTP-binding protein
MKPVIVLVGRPNVGKSTLFNALTRSRDAIVADEPGLTRDRQYGDGRVGGRPYIIVDTGGIAASNDELRELSLGQTRQAMEEADAILFLTDARAGPSAGDLEIAADLRRLQRPVTLVVNKMEGLDPDLALAEFHALGLGQPIAISAAHAQGLDTLVQRVLAPFPITEEAEPQAAEVPRIAVAGRPNVGKSTLVNALLGEERVIASSIPGTTRDSVRIPLERAGKQYVLIDTAGVRRRGRVEDAIEKYTVVKTLQAIDDANVVILVLDAQQEISEQDATLAGYILDQGRALVLAVNKWDGLEASQRAWIKRELERKLAFLVFAKPHFISALNGTHVGDLFPAIDRAFASARRALTTPSLNRILEQAVAALPPPVVKGRRIKMKFVHQGGKNPPLIIIHGNQVDAVPEAYRRYLSNTFAKKLKLEGTPVRIEFKAGENPFKDRTKVLTKRQHEKRRRHRRHLKKKYGD